MTIKSVILADYIQNNKFTLAVPGLPAFTLLSLGGIEEELDNVDLPDRTTQTGGRTKPFEFDIAIPMHHSVEMKAMESWYEECKDPVSPTHKKLGTLTMFSQSNLTQISYMLDGLFPQKRGLPDLDLDSDGEMAMVTWTMKGDEVFDLQ
jgi:hypothetical protein